VWFFSNRAKTVPYGCILKIEKIILKLKTALRVQAAKSDAPEQYF